MRRLSKDNFAHMDAGLQTTMVSYFTDFRPKLRNSCDAKRWAEDESALNLLKALPLGQASQTDMRERFDSASKAQ